VVFNVILITTIKSVDNVKDILQLND